MSEIRGDNDNQGKRWQELADQAWACAVGQISSKVEALECPIHHQHLEVSITKNANGGPDFHFHQCCCDALVDRARTVIDRALNEYDD